MYLACKFGAWLVDQEWIDKSIKAKSLVYEGLYGVTYNGNIYSNVLAGKKIFVEENTFGARGESEFGRVNYVVAQMLIAAAGAQMIELQYNTEGEPLPLTDTDQTHDYQLIGAFPDKTSSVSSAPSISFVTLKKDFIKYLLSSSKIVDLTKPLRPQSSLSFVKPILSKESLSYINTQIQKLNTVIESMDTIVSTFSPMIADGYKRLNGGTLLILHQKIDDGFLFISSECPILEAALLVNEIGEQVMHLNDDHVILFPFTYY